ncbi:hypothetical protein PIB30_085228 [Stylosanthes scabra]|uniref:Uncharacterized protein n=1 Tax=Stylosanthes scabra TaxID=79078 RepID=A0ABU6WR35_9FABA|nr:hypothetical protein [Stylosanthes scabra]
MTEIPAIFYKNFREELSDSVIFTNESGNEIDVIVRGDRTAVIVKGLLNISYVYGLSFGGWLKVLYMGKNIFYTLKVMDHNMNYSLDEVRQKMSAVVVDTYTGSGNPSASHRAVVYSVVRVMSKYQAHDYALLLPARFVVRAFQSRWKAFAAKYKLRRGSVVKFSVSSLDETIMSILLEKHVQFREMWDTSKMCFVHFLIRLLCQNLLDIL